MSKQRKSAIDFGEVSNMTGIDNKEENEVTEKVYEEESEKEVTQPSVTETDSNDEVRVEHTEANTYFDVSNLILNRRKRVEDTHERKTFMIRKDLNKRLDYFAKKINTVGFKTRFINMVIEEGLEKLENELKQNKN